MDHAPAPAAAPAAAPPTAATEVFISYQRGERDAVAIIAQRLIELRVAVWFDRALKPGGTFDEEISRHLSQARAVLTCWTPAAMASDWVRAEAALARESDKLVACLLEPVQLLPPFNLIHAEDLCTWAGQEDDPAWLKILARIGELTGRPGLESYTQVMRPGGTIEALRAWALDNGDDALVDTVWQRLRQLEGENQAERIAREKAEAEATARRRRAQAERSKELAKARGVRSGGADRSMLRRLLAAVVVLAVVLLAGVGYLLDAQRRGRALEAAGTPQQLAAFIAANRWHPVATDARRRFALLDVETWTAARTRGSLAAIDGYLTGFSGDPAGAHLDEAYAARQQALARREVQQRLARLGLYSGELDGANTDLLQRAIQEFQYGATLALTGQPDAALLAALDRRIAERAATRPEQLKASHTNAPTLDDYVRIAARLRVNALVLQAIQAVESNGRGFDAGGRPLIRFERHVFSRRTEGRFDRQRPEVSNPRPGPALGQEAEWRHLKAAFELSPQDAYAATSIGMFGIMGFHAQRLGFETPAELARFQSESEARQVEALARFLETEPPAVLGSLRTPNWTGFDPASWEAFASAYNGRDFRRLRYHEKLALAYRRAAQRMGVELPATLAPIADAERLLPQPRAAGRGQAIPIPQLGEEASAAPWQAALLAALSALAALATARAVTHARRR